jgi:hypothetical protein
MLQSDNIEYEELPGEKIAPIQRILFHKPWADPTSSPIGVARVKSKSPEINPGLFRYKTTSAKHSP